ncbi:hypothetical protein D7Z54_02865 [Salibacterium salarium]|uniref:Uncharacterized protein n=1 Tax=Salibacterium salarium TaxID=284579 RepID=A0A3R9QWC3_9BACI|nr:hypothetical protein D7Z54_02865 [Salibacterium salarium]
MFILIIIVGASWLGVASTEMAAEASASNLKNPLHKICLLKRGLFIVFSYAAISLGVVIFLLKFIHTYSGIPLQMYRVLEMIPISTPFEAQIFCNINRFFPI